MAYEPVLTKHVGEPNSYTLDFYLKNQRGYEGLRKALTLKPNDIIEQVKASGLRGRGGAGFPTGLKWQFVLKDTPKPKYICCNADESEPGTFKDHVLMERNPHLLIEGCAISLLRDRREGRLHLHPRRVLPRPGNPRGRDREGLQGRLSRQEHPRQRLRLRRLHAPRRRRLRSGRGDGADRVARRASARSRGSSRRFPRSPASISARPRSTTSRRCATCRSSC